MNRFPLYVALLAASASIQAQDVSLYMFDGQVLTSQYQFDPISGLSDDYVPPIPLYTSTLSETFGGNADEIEIIARAALDRHDLDRFKWSKKNTYPIKHPLYNSCGNASERLYNYMLDGPGGFPDGWEVREVGELGALTTFEEYTGKIWDDKIMKWYDGKPTGEINVDPLDPFGYAHVHLVVKSPDGDYLTLDTWGDAVEMRRVYPIDDDATFFSDEPGETDVQNAGLRLSQVDRLGRGRPWDTPAPGEPTPEDEQETERDKSEEPSTSPETPVNVVTSLDPNDKLGLLGVGDERYITPDNLFRYTIRFENFASASAPAQEVLVRDTLDLSALDASTLELGQIRFGDTRVNVPPGRTAFSARVPFGDGLEVVITAGLVVETGVLTWRFASVDTETGDLPADPFDGFLPPNQSPPEGEGSVSFRIRSQPGLPDGTTVRNEARIFFDLNEPIDTPPWVNVVDHRAPSSAIVGLAASQADTLFAVEWGGSDAGSGVSHYDVYVSKDGEPFLPYLQRVARDSTLFAGERGSTYGFYTIATDQLGNREAPKTEPDAVTAVGVSAEEFAGLPEALTLGAARPNPTAGRATFRYGLPAPGHVRLHVYDLLGRRVATLTEGQRPAGWHEAQLSGGLAPGLYVVRLQAGREAQTQKVTVVR